MYIYIVISTHTYFVDYSAFQAKINVVVLPFNCNPLIRMYLFKLKNLFVSLEEFLKNFSICTDKIISNKHFV